MLLQMAQKMIETGAQTQQGYLRAAQIVDIYLVEDMKMRSHVCIVGTFYSEYSFVLFFQILVQV